MKSYLLVSGSLFGLLTLAHIWRLFVEPTLVRDPWFHMTTLLAAILCVWAFRLHFKARRRSAP